MTNTGRWFESRRRELLFREGLGVMLGTAGFVLAALTLGVMAAKTGLLGAVPPLVVIAWGLVLSMLGGGLYIYRKRVNAFRASAIAKAVEASGGLRRGSMLGMVFGIANGSPALIEAADTRSRQWLESHGKDALHGMRRHGTRTVWSGAIAGVLGAAIFAASNPTQPDAMRFWSPAATLVPNTGAVEVTVDRQRVSRGESVNVTVNAPGGQEAQFFTREPGEAWSSRKLVLDSTGTTTVRLGPLNADRYVRATSSGRESRTVRIEVAIPAFLADLTLVARFPNYLERIDEVVQPGDSLLLPEGTELVTTGSATVGLEHVGWRTPDGRTIAIAVDDNGSSFQGVTALRTSGTWSLDVVPADGRVLDQAAPTLNVTMVPDSSPSIAVPLPGVDTIAPPSLRQPVVVDVRDDHGLSLVEALTRRAGDPLSDARVDTLLLPPAATDRAVLSWLLDLNDRDMDPGDTLYYRIRAADNAPVANVAQTREFALRLPSESELRQSIRDVTEQLAANADSLRARQQELTRETESLAATQQRVDDQQRQGDEGLEFSEAERAGEIADEQSDLIEEADELTKMLQDIAESAWEAGMTDPEWHKQLAELQDMMQQAVTPELQTALEDLQKALENLDPEALREALERMIEQQQQMQEQFERSQDLFERAAMEGAMSTLADDAEEISQRQEELNEAMESGMADSAAARSQDALASETEQLRQQLEQLANTMQQAGEQQTEGVQQSQQQAGNAQQNMQQGAQQSRQGQSQEAQQSGQQASQQMQSIPQDLREQLEQMRGAWKDEVLDQMDMALAETADLARRQDELANRMQRGESSADIRGEQAAVREGVDQIIQRLQDVAGKNALVSPDLSTSLGYSRVKMTESLQQFEQPTPNTRQASQLAAEALDGLNAVAAALLRSRGDVEGSQSGSGMAEAMEQMAQMAAQQEALNAETGGMMPLMPQGGEQLLQQLQQLADQQQSLGEDLEEMAAEEGLPGGTEELAEEAIDIAEQLAAGRLDAETLERQEDLFRKLLDAGRSLRSDEEDDKKERQSVTAEQDIIGVPPPLDPSATGPGLRYPYPSWEQLRRFSASERRIILNYFRRLNAARP